MYCYPKTMTKNVERMSGVQVTYKTNCYLDTLFQVWLLFLIT